MPFSSTTITTEAYTPNGVTTIFPFYFLALSEDELQVVLTDAQGNETLLTEGFDVVGVGEPSGGYIQFPVAPNYAGQTLSIRAAPHWYQEQDFENQGPYNPREVNKALDRLAQKILWLRDYGGLGGGTGQTGTVSWASIQGKPLAFTPAAHVHAAADITSGVLDAARIPTLDAAKIGTGTLAAARVPSLDASKITTGVIDAARLPAIGGGVVSPGAIADLTAPQQAAIVEGTLVTTTDGRQWRYTGAGSKTLEASYVELSTGATWAGLSGKPPELVSFAALSGVADKIAYFSGVDTLSLADFSATGRALVALASQAAAIAYTSPLTTKGDLYVYSNAPTRLGVGTNGQVLTADSTQATGVRWATPAGSGGSGNDPNFVTVFSGNGDGSTNNDAAFTAAEASANERIYLPEGVYLTTKAANQLTKHYYGPGVLRVAGPTILPNLKSLTTPITQLTSGGVFSEYGESSGQIDFSDAQYQYIRPGTRENINLSAYFHAGATGVFRRFFNSSGSSGTDAHLAATAAAGATSATLNSVDGLAIGNTIGFQVGDNAEPGDVVTITNIAGNVITFTPALANTYTVYGTDYFPPYLSGYPQSPQVSKGRRTNNSHYFLTVSANAPGDTYGFLIRTAVDYTPKAGQTHFFDTATVAAIGGDMTFSKDGQYGTPWEHNALDLGFDVGVINVDTYTRTNDTGARGVAWVHSLIKSEGTKPIDAAFALVGKMRTGLDTTQADLSSDGERAIQLKMGQRIYFDASATGAIGTRARGYWGNVQGDTYITGGNDGSDFLDLWVGGTRALRARGASLNTNVQVNIANNVGVNGQLAVNEGQTIRLNGINGTTYFQIVAGNVVLVKNGSVVATW